MRLQRSQPKAVVVSIPSVSQGQLGCGVVAVGVALPDHLEQTIQRIADVMAAE